MIEDENFRSFLLRLGEKGRPKDKLGFTAKFLLISCFSLLFIFYILVFSHGRIVYSQ